MSPCDKYIIMLV